MDTLYTREAVEVILDFGFWIGTPSAKIRMVSQDRKRVQGQHEEAAIEATGEQRDAAQPIQNPKSKI
jgi:hypothetical protein